MFNVGGGGGGRCGEGLLCGYRSLNWTFVICDGIVIGAEALIDELKNNNNNNNIKYNK